MRLVVFSQLIPATSSRNKVPAIRFAMAQSEEVQRTRYRNGILLHVDAVAVCEVGVGKHAIGMWREINFQLLYVFVGRKKISADNFMHRKCHRICYDSRTPRNNAALIEAQSLLI